MGFSITTKQPSVVVRRFLQARSAKVHIRIDRKHYTEADIPWLLETWCTNKNIRSTIDFEIRQDERPVFGFHDNINEAWADDSERDIVESLVRDKVVRMRRLDYQNNRHTRPWIRQVFSWIREQLRVFLR